MYASFLTRWRGPKDSQNRHLLYPQSIKERYRRVNIWVGRSEVVVKIDNPDREIVCVSPLPQTRLHRTWCLHVDYSCTPPCSSKPTLTQSRGKAGNKSMLCPRKSSLHFTQSCGALVQIMLRSTCSGPESGAAQIIHKSSTMEKERTRPFVEPELVIKPDTRREIPQVTTLEKNLLR